MDELGGEVIEVKFKEQEYEDLLSAVGMAIKIAPKDSPQFKKALERLNNKLWRKKINEQK